MSVLSARDLVVIIKNNIKIILAFAVALSVLGGAYKGFTGVKSITNFDENSSQPANYSTQLEKYKQEKSDIADVISTMEDHIASAYRYASENPIMSIDPSDCTYSTVVVDFTDPQSNFSDYIRGIIANADGTKVFDCPNDILNKYKSDIFYIDKIDVPGEVTTFVFGVEGVDSHDSANRLKQMITSDSALVGSIKTVQVADYNSGCQHLYLRQRDIIKDAYESQYDLRNIKEYERQIEAPSIGSSAPSKGDITRSSIKYGVIGLIIGAIIGALLVLFKVTQDGTVFLRTQMDELFDLDCIGTINKNNDSKELLSMNMQAVSEKGDTVVVVDDCDYAGTLISDLKLNDFDRDTKYLAGKNIIDDTNTIALLEKADSLTLIVNKGKTKISDVQKQIRRANTLGIRILGYIFAE